MTVKDWSDYLPTAVRVVLRFLWYFVSRLLVWALAIGFIVLAFFAAMDYMNVRILTSDGLQVRAAVIIQGEDPTTLSKVFSKGFLEQDTMLNSDKYQDYLVSDFDYEIEIGFALILPWQNTAKLRVTEQVSKIKAEVYTSNEKTETVSETPPAWENAVFDITLARYEDNWRIVGMEQIEVLPQPTPSPTATNVPSAATPTPKPEPIEEPIEE